MVSMLQIGMLWFDDAPQRTLVAKIALAAQRYQDKYGNVPNVCYVHPSSLAGAPAQDKGTAYEPTCMRYKDEYSIQVLAAHDILPNHLWLGVTERGQESLN
jgi:hypothetical protein